MTDAAKGGSWHLWAGVVSSIFSFSTWDAKEGESSCLVYIVHSRPAKAT